MSKSFKASMVGLLVSAAAAAALASPPSAAALGGNLECDNSVHLMLYCDLDAQGLGSTLTNIEWYYNGVLFKTGGVYADRSCGTYPTPSPTITATYTQAGQNITDAISTVCNTGPSK